LLKLFSSFAVRRSEEKDGGCRRDGSTTGKAPGQPIAETSPRFSKSSPPVAPCPAGGQSPERWQALLHTTREAAVLADELAALAEGSDKASMVDGL